MCYDCVFNNNNNNSNNNNNNNDYDNENESENENDKLYYSVKSSSKATQASLFGDNFHNTSN